MAVRNPLRLKLNLKSRIFYRKLMFYKFISSLEKYFIFYRFEDFYIDQFVDYLESDVNGNGHDASSQNGNHQKHQLNSNNNHKPCNYQCTVCRETLGSGSELLKHVRTHTRMIGSQHENNLKVCI